ncbi:MAG TPA: lysylphosphatidylglycerol synthase domain-containing protein [Burkholderiaceae bacterium]|jgi:uncharacterized membrane protein YbhN (UPF0104 family)|nr:lysylphosphatidylglycerol synthase domain-containing protein [Burkholderiaceae bacterium]
MSDWSRRAALVLVSAVLLAIVAAQIDVRQAAALALRPHALAWLAAALLLFNVSKITGAHRLNCFQRHAAIALSGADNLRLYYAGMFLNVCLPGGIGGDGYKVAMLAKHLGTPIKTALLATVADRVSGLLPLLALLALLLPALPLPWLPGAVAALAILLSSLALAVLLHRRLLGMTARRSVHMLLLGAAVQLLQLACMGTLLAFQQVALPALLPYLALFLVSSAVAVLPFSWGGLGLRELTFLFGARLLQCDPLPGIVASSAFFLITLLSALPGALFLSGIRSAGAP